MALFTEVWSRNSFDVECVQVTEENIIAVAMWCQGEIKYTSDGSRYVRFEATPNVMPVIVNAHIGDWVLFVGGKFKHYRNASFKTAYSKKRNLGPKIQEIIETALSVEDNALGNQQDVAVYYTSIIVQLIKGE